MIVFMIPSKCEKTMKMYLSPWLYFKEGDDRHLYRAIPESHDAFLEVARTSKYFPRFELTNDQLKVGPNECCRLIKIDKLPFQVRIQETTRRQALTIIKMLVDFAIETHDSTEFTPADIHEGNVVWWDRPVFLDVDAFMKREHATAALTFVRIAYLLYRYVCEVTLPSHDQFNLDTLKTLDGWMPSRAGIKNFDNPVLWRELRAILDTISLTPRPTHWSEEYAAVVEENEKIEKLDELVPSGRTLLDIGCNKGYVTSKLSSRFEACLGVDVDEACIDIACERFSKTGVNFARVDLRAFQAVQPLPIHERFKADVVLALAITHHLAQAGFSVTYVAETLCKLAEKFLLIEDIVYVAEYEKHFAHHGFERVRHVASYPKERSLSLWCKR